EDDTENREAVARVLRGAGHEVLAAATGRDGLKLLHGGAHPDLILLDFWLPDMTGHAFLEAKARWPGGLHSPVLLVTGDDAWIDEQRDFEQLGVVGLLAKPLEAAELLSAVERDYSAATAAHLTELTRNDAELATTASPAVEKQARRFADLLSRASEILAHGSELELALRELLRLIVPGLADWCVLERVDGARSSASAFAHVNPELEAKLRGLLARETRLLRGFDEVIRNGVGELHSEISPERLSQMLVVPEDREQLLELGFGSALIVPVIARRQVFGCLLWASRGARRYGVRHLETATDLGHRLALTIDNDQLRKASQRAVRAREELLAIVSHDLRTPLSAIATTASNLLRGAPPETLSRDAATILSNSRRMERMIRDLLDFSQLEAGSLRVELRRENLAQLVRHAVESARPMAARHRLVVDVSEEAKDIEVLCDRERIFQVLSNLVGNAVKYTEAQGRIKVRLSRLPAEALVSVIDSGRGIAQHELPALFDRYFQGQTRPVVHGSNGAGLGLYIARGLIEAHGGRMWAESAPESGSTFCFTLPPCEQLPQADSAVARPILLVDDDVAFRRELKEILEEQGYNVETADNGWQAWAYLQANPPPALILLDLMMPVMDGWELHAALKSHPELSSVPVVVLSCFDRYRIEPSLHDIHGYIEKPIRTSQLMNIVSQHVSRAERSLLPPAPRRAAHELLP
ncbi:MAG TPA: response regulator, partial [Polyangiales bacterium]|nr:response regulator [Polyangiales bacterium]